MRTVYIDSEFKSHIDNDGTMTAVETDFFDGKCSTYIEGFLCVPYGKSRTRKDGQVFHGQSFTAWKPFEELDAAQRQYEQERLADAENALAILYGGKTA